MALIFIGVVGLLFRIVSGGSTELTLKGILPISPDSVDQITLVSVSPDSETKLVRVGDTWLVNRAPVFLPKLVEFWNSVGEIDGAQLVSINPDNHERIGVADGQGLKVAFFFGGSKQEEFLVGKWTPDVRLCYLRRSGRDEVYGIPCPNFNVFDPNPDGWRNPVIVTIPRTDVESITFSYPGEEFNLRLGEGGWVVDDGSTVDTADLFQVSDLLSSLELLIADGFAGEAEADVVDFFGPEAMSVRVVTGPEAQTPTTRLRFVRRDNLSYYVSTPTQATVFITSSQLADTVLKRFSDFLVGN